MMWREETGFLEMFFSYYGQFERRSMSAVGLRNFLFDVLSLHDRSQKFRQHTGADPFSISSSEEDVFGGNWDSSLASLSGASDRDSSPSPPRKRKRTETAAERVLLQTRKRRIAKERASGRIRTQAKDRTPEQPESVEVASTSRSRVTLENVKGGADGESFEAFVIRPSPSYHDNDSPANSIQGDTPDSPSNIVSDDDTKEKKRFGTKRLRIVAKKADTPGSKLAEILRSSPVDLDPQRATQPTAQPSLLPCKYCDQTFESSAGLLLHRETHKTERPFACYECPSLFKSEPARDRHHLTHAGKTFTCIVCSKTFQSQDGLTKHFKSLHGEMNVFECGICQKKLKSVAYLSRHMKTHEKPDRHKCRYCGKICSFLSCLKAHEITHTGQFPFECTICIRKFVKKWNYENHMRVHSDFDKGRRFAYNCAICKVGFDRLANFNLHKRKFCLNAKRENVEKKSAEPNVSCSDDEDCVQPLIERLQIEELGDVQEQLESPDPIYLTTDESEAHSIIEGSDDDDGDDDTPTVFKSTKPITGDGAAVSECSGQSKLRKSSKVTLSVFKSPVQQTEASSNRTLSSSPTDSSTPVRVVKCVKNPILSDSSGSKFIHARFVKYVKRCKLDQQYAKSPVKQTMTDSSVSSKVIQARFVKYVKSPVKQTLTDSNTSSGLVGCAQSSTKPNAASESSLLETDGAMTNPQSVPTAQLVKIVKNHKFPAATTSQLRIVPLLTPLGPTDSLQNPEVTELMPEDRQEAPSTSRCENVRNVVAERLLTPPFRELRSKKKRGKGGRRKREKPPPRPPVKIAPRPSERPAKPPRILLIKD